MHFKYTNISTHLCMNIIVNDTHLIKYPSYDTVSSDLSVKDKMTIKPESERKL